MLNMKSPELPKKYRLLSEQTLCRKVPSQMKTYSDAIMRRWHRELT